MPKTKCVTELVKNYIDASCGRETAIRDGPPGDAPKRIQRPTDKCRGSSRAIRRAWIKDSGERCACTGRLGVFILILREPIQGRIEARDCLSVHTFDEIGENGVADASRNDVDGQN